VLAAHHLNSQRSDNGISDSIISDSGSLLSSATSYAGSIVRQTDDDGSQQFAEAWLRSWITSTGEISASVSAQLPISLAVDANLLQGALWLGIDQRGLGLPFLERVYERHRSQPAALYALGLEFERLGAYRLSILAIQRLLELSPVHRLEDTPRFLLQRVYPIPFADLIVKEAEARQFDPRLYFGLIRQESLFEEGARSGAAAQGLAQIIPDTADWVAQRLGHPEWRDELIYHPYINLQFGAYYLDWCRDYLDNNLVSALVGYNAGPGNAEVWRKALGADDALFVELLPVGEPSIYVKAITTNLFYYSYLYPD
jgi:soluble lytic murein transglycosylase